MYPPTDGSPTDISTPEAYRRQIAELTARLGEAEETLNAIRNGDVDAVVVNGSDGHAIYTLDTADRPYRLLIEQMREGAVTMTPDGTVLYANQALADLLDVPATDIVGSYLRSHIAAADVPTFERLLTAGGRAEMTLCAHGDHHVAVQLALSLVASDQDQLACAVVTDLTEARAHAGELGAARARLAAEAARRESDERYRLILESATDYAIIATDLNERVTIWNTGARNILGWSEDDVVGHPMPVIWTPEDQAAGVPEWEMATALADGRAEAERWHLRNDDSRFWAHGLLMPLRGADDIVIGFLKILRDRTEQRKSEQARVAFNDRLERRVADRTEELAAANNRLQVEMAERERIQDQLRQAQKIEAIGHLTGGVAHDFNNLLAAIMGNIDLVQRRLPIDVDPKITRMLSGAMQATERGAALTKRLLAFARRQDLRSGPVDLAALMAGMQDLLARSLGPSVALHIDLPDLPPARADAHQLEMAVLNLAVNARDAMPAGGRLTISAREEHVAAAKSDLEVGDYVVLAVTDTGTGMDDLTLKRAAEPFFTTKGAGKGTGLGLSMVFGLMAQLEGRLKLINHPDEGLTAEMWMQISKDVVVPPDAGVAGEPGKVDACRVLFVDDDPLVREATTAMLEDLGHRVAMASSGAAALDLLRDGAEFDVLLTDHAMPEMTGTELAARVRAERPGLPIILATGFADVPEGSASTLPRLAKPYKRDALSAAIGDVVRTR